MDYKEYKIEDKKLVNLEELKSNPMTREDYIKAHRDTIIACADVIIWYNLGFLLVQRDNFPGKGELWAIGGRILRGSSVEENIIKKAKLECNLDLKNLKLLSIRRTSFKTDPFNHGKGTDIDNSVN